MAADDNKAAKKPAKASKGFTAEEKAAMRESGQRAEGEH